MAAKETVGTVKATATETVGDVGGGGGDTAIAAMATATAMAVMIAGSFRRYSTSHRGKECKPPNQKRIPLHVHGILFRRIMDGGCDSLNPAEINPKYWGNKF